MSIFLFYNLSNSILPSPHGRQLRKLLTFPFLNLPAASFPTPLYPIGNQEAAQISSVRYVSHLASSSPVQQQVAILVLSALPTPWMSEFILSGNIDIWVSSRLQWVNCQFPFSENNFLLMEKCCFWTNPLNKQTNKQRIWVILKGWISDWSVCCPIPDFFQKISRHVKTHIRLTNKQWNLISGNPIF